MKKLLFSFVLFVAFVPFGASAAILKINNLGDSNQFLATTTATSTMHMRIVPSGADTHVFQWDNTPWMTDQGGSGTTTFSNGPILFFNNNVFSQDTSNLFWDALNRALLIGVSTSSSVAKLTVKGASNQALLNLVASSSASAVFVTDAGNVGIGNISPQYALDVSGSMYSRLVNLSDGATISIDWNSGNTQTVTLGGNRTISLSGAKAGAHYTLILNQDATGNRTITWPSNINWQGATVPVLSTAASTTDVIDFIAVSTTTYLASSRLGYAAPSTRITEVFTTSQSWSVPTGVTQIDVKMWGAGGGGGGAANGSGGGAGAYVSTTSISVSPSESVSITIGQGGAGGSGSSGGTGGSGYGNGGNGGFDATGGGGGGGSSGVAASSRTVIAAGGGGGAAHSGAAGSGGSGASGTAGGNGDAGGTVSGGGGGGGGASTAGSNASGQTGGNGGTGASLTSGTNGNGSPAQGAGGSSAGTSGNGNNASGTSGGVGSGGAAAGTNGATGESGGGGNQNGNAGGVPGAGGGGSDAGAGGAGGNGRVEISYIIES